MLSSVRMNSPHSQAKEPTVLVQVAPSLHGTSLHSSMSGGEEGEREKRKERERERREEREREEKRERGDLIHPHPNISSYFRMPTKSS